MIRQVIRIAIAFLALAMLTGMSDMPQNSAVSQNPAVSHKHHVKHWKPIYDQSIDPAAPRHSIWLLVNPRAQDCAVMVKMVQNGDLAPEAVYDPEAACVKLGYVK